MDKEMKFTQYKEDPHWEEYFTTRSLAVKYYETMYESEIKNTKCFNKLKLRVSTLKSKNGYYYYVWDLTTDEISMNDLVSPKESRLENLTESGCSYQHPFAKIEKDEIKLKKDNTLHIGGINAKNCVMDSLIEMIMMTDDKMEQNCGSTCGYDYRQTLIKMLHIELWD
jgi:hypothetical protein